MLRAIDGKIHHLKELQFIEEVLYKETLSPDNLYKEIKSYLTKNYDLAEKTEWTLEELKALDSHLGAYFSQKISESRAWLLRAYIVGRYLNYTDIARKTFNMAKLETLPKYVYEAAKEYGLSLEEAATLQQVLEKSAVNMTNTTDAAIGKVKKVMAENVQVRGNAKDVIEELRKLVSDDAGEINRDFKRLIATEANKCFNDGYISLLSEGDYVVGISMPDACESCLDLINGKVYRVRKEPVPDYSELEGEEYLKAANLYDKYIWVGKTNIGRSRYAKKKIDPSIGNKKDNLEERKHHELLTPTLPLHGECRCRYVTINPEYQWIDEGRIRLRVENENSWKKWYRKIQSEYPN
jgi:hypothetical protein